MKTALFAVTVLGLLGFFSPGSAAACCCMEMDDMGGMQAMEQGGGSMEGMGRQRPRAPSGGEALAENAPTDAVCPVDGMKIRVTGDTPATEFQGRTYYFCSEEEQRKFLRHPERFAAK